MLSASGHTPQSARRLLCGLCAAALLFSAGPAAQSLDIQFDYRFDDSNFFVGHIERQLVLEAAAQTFELHLQDSLSAIIPGGNNHWKQIFPHPSTGALIKVKDDIIPPDTLRVYVGGRFLPDGALGIGGPGGFAAKGELQFLKRVETRGQKGAGRTTATDFGPWGGVLSFDLGTDWSFDLDVTSIEDVGSQQDFYSIAVHELGHLFGFGTAASWMRNVRPRGFNGAASVAENSGADVPLTRNGRHWAEGTESRVTFPLMIDNQEAAMDPTLTAGTRKYFTELDYAGLEDIGWSVVPEPGTGSLVVSSLFVLLRRRFGRSPA